SVTILIQPDQRQRSSRSQQRDSEVQRLQHRRWRTDQAGQDLVVLRLPLSIERRRPAQLRGTDRRDALSHDALESVRKGDLADEPEQQTNWLLAVGTETAAQPPAWWHRQLLVYIVGWHARAAVGKLGLQGRVERDAGQEHVRGGAVRRLRLLLPASG